MRPGGASVHVDPYLRMPPQHRTAEGSFDIFSDMANAVIRQAAATPSSTTNTTDFWTGTFEGSGQSDSTVIKYSSRFSVL